MTLEFGARFSQVLRGYIGISGYVYDSEQLLKEANQEVMRAPWLVTHGTEDEVLPLEDTRNQINDLITGGFKIDYREYFKAHTIDEKKELPDLRAWILACVSL